MRSFWWCDFGRFQLFSSFSFFFHSQRSYNSYFLGYLVSSIFLKLWNQFARIKRLKWDKSIDWFFAYFLKGNQIKFFLENFWKNSHFKFKNLKTFHSNRNFSILKILPFPNKHFSSFFLRKYEFVIFLK